MLESSLDSFAYFHQLETPIYMCSTFIVFCLMSIVPLAYTVFPWPGSLVHCVTTAPRANL